MEITPKFIILVGISGSGKSTFIKSLDLSNTVIVSPDAIRKEITGNVSDQTKNGEVFALANKRAADALNGGKDVIFDATNISSTNRQSLLKYLRFNTSRNFEPLAKIFPAEPEICKARIRKDIENGVDRSDVPDYAIDRQCSIYNQDIGKIESDGYKILN